MSTELTNDEQHAISEACHNLHIGHVEYRQVEAGWLAHAAYNAALQKPQEGPSWDLLYTDEDGWTVAGVWNAGWLTQEGRMAVGVVAKHPEWLPPRPAPEHIPAERKGDPCWKCGCEDFNIETDECQRCGAFAYSVPERVVPQDEEDTGHFDVDDLVEAVGEPDCQGSIIAVLDGGDYEVLWHGDDGEKGNEKAHAAHELRLIERPQDEGREAAAFLLDCSTRVLTRLKIGKPIEFGLMSELNDAVAHVRVALSTHPSIGSWASVFGPSYSNPEKGAPRTGRRWWE